MTTRAESISIWGISLQSNWLSDEQLEYLAGVPPERPPVEWMWLQMDKVWHDLGLENTRPLAAQPIATYSAHPVWLLNGIFTATDPDSIRHRTAISQHLCAARLARVADFGGGFGELARRILQQSPTTAVDVIEPFPSGASRALLASHEGARFVDDLNGSYDAVVAQDVLEHVEDPVSLAIRLANATRPGGVLIFANCFYPVIECHLPATFYLRHTFSYVMVGLGLRDCGAVAGAEHARVFVRKEELNIARCHSRDTVARALGPAANQVAPLIGPLLRRLGLR